MQPGLSLTGRFNVPKLSADNLCANETHSKWGGTLLLPEADAMLILTCSCGQKMRVPSSAVGKTVACVKCNEKISVTDETASPVEQQPLSASASGGSSAAAVEGDGQQALDMLLAKKLVSEGQLEHARLVQADVGRRAWEVLVDSETVSPGDFQALMGHHENIANIDLANYKVPGDVVQFVPEDTVKRCLVFPIDKLGSMLTLAIACPVDGAALQEVQERTGMKIKLMLCGLPELRARIHEAYPKRRPMPGYGDPFGKEMMKEFGGLLESNETAERIYDMEDLPPLKQAVEKIGQANGGGGDLKQLAQLGAMDPILAIRLLSVANSAAYGFAKRVDDVALAVTLMGSEGTVAAASTGGGEDYLGRDDGFNYKGFWKRARFCSDVARSLGEASESQRKITAANAAFLSGIGRMSLLKLLPKSYAVTTKGLLGEDLLKIERRFYGFDHAEAGYMVARKSNLPSGLTEAIRHCYSPANATKSREVVSIVALACRMADSVEGGASLDLDGAGDLLEKLNLEPEQVQSIYSQAVSNPS